MGERRIPLTFRIYRKEDVRVGFEEIKIEPAYVLMDTKRGQAFCLP